MKQFRLLNSEDGIIVDEVDARQCKYCSTAFIYKNTNGLWYLVDKATGQAICYAKTLNYLELRFSERKPAYEEYLHTDAYKIKVERFEKLKLVYNYSKGER